MLIMMNPCCICGRWIMHMREDREIVCDDCLKWAINILAPPTPQEKQAHPEFWAD